MTRLPLAPAVCIVPLAFATHGRWGEAAVDGLKFWARRRLEQSDAVQSVRPRGIYAEVLRRWRASGACALQRGNYAVYAACTGKCSSFEGADGMLRGPRTSPFSTYLVERCVM